MLTFMKLTMLLVNLDFINKMHIALKECYETEYWLIIFKDSSLLGDDEYKNLYNQCFKIRMKLVNSINTAKQNLVIKKENTHRRCSSRP